MVSNGYATRFFPRKRSASPFESVSEIYTCVRYWDERRTLASWLDDGQNRQKAMVIP